jgi:cytochrome c-type biogenesis protein CcmH/NrfF
MRTPTERQLFGALRCMCGTCARDLLSTCACETAQQAREEIRGKLSRGESAEQIIAAYQSAYGSEALAIPPNTGAMRAIYAVPIVAIVGGAVALGATLRKWTGREKAATVAPPPPGVTGERVRDPYDDKLDQELRELDD